MKFTEMAQRRTVWGNTTLLHSDDLQEWVIQVEGEGESKSTTRLYRVERDRVAFVWKHIGLLREVCGEGVTAGHSDYVRIEG